MEAVVIVACQQGVGVLRRRYVELIKNAVILENVTQFGL